jgi:hypothetical protein
MQPVDSFMKAREAGERGTACLRGQSALRVESGADAQCFAPCVLPVNLVAFDAPHLQPEAVRAHVDDGERAWGNRFVRHGRGSVAETTSARSMSPCSLAKRSALFPFLLRSTDTPG